MGVEAGYGGLGQIWDAIWNHPWDYLFIPHRQTTTSWLELSAFAYLMT